MTFSVIFFTDKTQASQETRPVSKSLTKRKPEGAETPTGLNLNLKQEEI